MSFAFQASLPSASPQAVALLPLHAAPAAAADAAYLEDCRMVQDLLQQLRRFSSSIRRLKAEINSLSVSSATGDSRLEAAANDGRPREGEEQELRHRGETKQLSDVSSASETALQGSRLSRKDETSWRGDAGYLSASGRPSSRDSSPVSSTPPSSSSAASSVSSPSAASLSSAVSSSLLLLRRQTELKEHLHAARAAAEGAHRRLSHIAMHAAAAASHSEKQHRQFMHQRLLQSLRVATKHLKEAAEELDLRSALAAPASGDCAEVQRPASSRASPFHSQDSDENFEMQREGLLDLLASHARMRQADSASAALSRGGHAARELALLRGGQRRRDSGDRRDEHLSPFRELGADAEGDRTQQGARASGGERDVRAGTHTRRKSYGLESRKGAAIAAAAGVIASPPSEEEPDSGEKRERRERRKRELECAQKRPSREQRGESDDQGDGSLCSVMRSNVPVEIPEGRIEQAIRREQLDGLAKIQSEIQGIQSLYEQLAYYVDAQQLGIDGVATLLDSTRDSSDQAARELVHARRLRCAATRRKCLLWAFFVVVVVVILWFLFFLH
ncbi:hypothetical protein TGME49_220190 [Toxoplasma gondii ME49]|uniref:t-SNARE coiled-coil homology domain-containing protein n=4 Tax=Toxoplasma gondii TaxID=5811 RepID=S8GRA9_TOXGM|nr:hypothetical protein TGME49_220190 [Toxoplasma gondii ME49]EPT31119.1 hypothetical protein TGME49_220190 [Toxoplasma gondii ME49]|eukprot:XP_002371544.1 hypothetical protein TGME49_220190 [Toxoplasma gondii ME49]